MSFLRQSFRRLCRGPLLPWALVGLLLAALAWAGGAAVLAAPVGGAPAVVEVAILRMPAAPAGLPTGPPGAAPATVRPAEPDGARVAVILAGAGLDPALARAALDLPAPVALAWSTYADQPPLFQAELRRRGHEIWLDLPVSQGDPARFDAGSLAISPTRSDADNLGRLAAARHQVPAPAGVLLEPGAFGARPQRLLPVLAALGEHRLPVVLHGEFATLLAREVPAEVELAAGSLRVTSLPARVDEFLQMLGAAATADGRALGVLPSHPLAIERLARWLRGMSAEGLTLVAPSSLLRSQVGVVPAEEGRAAVAASRQHEG
ncbi:divergent polysaccharide deacetylase family protein [Geminicoccus flavidas]|uniref:divergent polysaccharide deacetylase family protein n=1 Tax=Geminicoccus flavidas TaxID=2506407 RepID=UPI001359D34D|nr:divergent polysaccharide deacetylase family protein [Geminicoccus flavidas]